MTTAPPSPLQVLLVDDHDAVRQGLALLLEHEGLRVAGQAADPEAALAVLDATPCDVAVVDLTLGDESGVALLRELRARWPRLGLLAYSMHEERWYVEEALAAGAGGYVTKRDAAEHLARGIAEVAAGRAYFSPRIVQVAAAALAARAAPARGVAALSAQERRIYGLLGEGAAIVEIAAQLEVSPRTVQSYCARMLEKLDLPGMRQLRRQAIRDRRR